MPSRALKLGYFALAALNTFAAIFYFHYLFFFLRLEFGFSNRDNLLVAALNGFIYIFGSLFGGRFAQRRGYFKALYLGFGIMGVTLAVGAQLSTAPGQLCVMALWTIGVCFTWPTLEALVSEGETPLQLSGVIGIYNVVWAGGAALAYFTGGALLERLGRGSLFWLPAGLYLAQMALTAWLQRQTTAAHVSGGVRPSSGAETCQRQAPSQSIHTLEPAEDPAPEDGRTPLPGRDTAGGAGLNPRPIAKARLFLRLAWLANPFAYVAMNTVIPLIPDLTARLGLSTTLAGFVASSWLFARLGAFIVLWRWSGWHYQFGWLAGAYVVMALCFAVLLLVPSLAVIVLAQLAFGLAVGLIYYSSLFYSMDAGDTKSEHGGIHEALIGVGIFVGPGIGAGSQALFPEARQVGIWTVSALLGAGLIGLLWLRQTHRR
jgi:predicted MFS family arabinose efflux permease